MIKPETIERVLEIAAIEEVIGEFVHLKKAGSNYKGLSPFVDEKTPSFMVSPAKGIFKDFSSGKGGNVLSFLMEHEQMSYPEAIRWLAERYNIEVLEDKAEKTPEQLEEQSLRESLYIVNQFAQKTFSEILTETDEGKSIGLNYLKERQFSDESIEKFQLGYCLDQWDGFTKKAIENGYKLEYLEKTGLTKVNENKQFDFFKGRVMFPIHNVTGKVVGFGGRTLRSDKKVAKYFNSPESDIYNKSRILYGLYQAKKAISTQDNCYLVEGYTDVISFHQAGIENVVASSGTALTKEQISLIKRYTPNITILYDGDAAGIKASFRGIDLILEQGLNVKVVLFPDGDDPDSYAKKVSKTELEEYLDKNAKDFISFKTEILLEDTKGDPIKKAGLIRDIVQSISLIPDSIARQVYIKSCSQIFDIQEQALSNELAKFLRIKSKKEGGQSISQQPIVPLPTQQTKAVESTINHQERDIIRLLLNYADLAVKTHTEDDEGNDVEIEVPVAQYLITELHNDDIEFENSLYQEVINIYTQGLNDGHLPSPKVFYNSENEAIKNLAIDLTTDKEQLSENWQKKHKIYPETEEIRLQRAVDEALYIYKLKRVDLQLQSLQESLKEVSDDQIIEDTFKQIKQLKAVEMEISKRLSITIKK